MASSPAPEATKTSKLGIVALIGAAAAAVLVPLVDRWEGNELVPYQDIVKIWTNCRGNTKDVDPNKVMTETECEAINEQQLVVHAKPVLACVPQLKGRPNALAASISLAYNVGPTAFCGSTAARRFRSGDIRGGCDALLMWDRAGGRKVRGLANRRRDERALCLKDA